MAEFPALPLFTDALLADTEHLTNEEMGAYIRVLIIIWRNANCKIPNDDAWLRRRLKADEAEYARLYAPLVAEFLTSDGNYITQKRLLKEFTYLRGARGKQSANAKARWNKDKPPSRRIAPDPTPPQQEAAPVDFQKIIFDEGLRWVSGRAKRTPGTLRSLFGKWCSLYGDAAVAAAIVKAQQISAVEPVSYIEKLLKEKASENTRAGHSAATKTDRLYNAARSAVADANAGSGGEGKAGGDASPMLPGFEGVRS